MHQGRVGHDPAGLPVGRVGPRRIDEARSTSRHRPDRAQAPPRTACACSRRSTGPRPGSPRVSTATTAARRVRPYAPTLGRGARRVEGLRRPAGRRATARTASSGTTHPEVDPDADPHLADLERAELADLLPARGRPGRLRRSWSSPPRRRSPNATPSAEVILGGMFGTPFQGKPPALSAWDVPAPAVRDRRRPRQLRRGRRPSVRGARGEDRGSRSRCIHDEIAAADDNAGLWITEVGASSDDGKNPLELGPEGQAEQLRAAFEFFIDQREALDIEGVTWYSWRDTSDPPSATGAPGRACSRRPR